MKLDLSYNEIGEKGIEFISGKFQPPISTLCFHLLKRGSVEMLKWNQSVTYLDISSNKILDQGGKAVASMLGVNKYD